MVYINKLLLEVPQSLRGVAMSSSQNLKLEQLMGQCMHTLLLHTSDLMFVKDLNFNYLGASQPMAELLGLSDPSLMVGKNDFELFDDQSLARR